MKKVCFLFCIAVFSISLFGCSNYSADPVNNEVFTDDFFADVVEIKNYAYTVSGKEMKPVICFLKGASLSEPHIYEDTEEFLYGGFGVLAFKKSSGETVTFIQHGANLLCPSIGSFAVEEGFYAGLHESFGLPVA